MKKNHAYHLAKHILQFDWVHRARLLCALYIAVVFSSLVVWYVLPIYPDETALKMQLGRLIQDNFTINGLYAGCLSNIKQVPLILLPAAYIFSWFNLYLSPTEVRWLSFASIIGISFACSLRAIHIRSFMAPLLFFSSLLGVAASSLVMLRYEALQLLNLFLCLVVICGIWFGATTYSKAFISILIIFSFTLSIFTHLQGFIFLPICIYALYKLYGFDEFRKYFLPITLGISVLVVSGLIFNKSSCEQFPEVENFWRAMNINWNELREDISFVRLQAKLNLYARSFLYQYSYSIDYLPHIQQFQSPKQGVKILNYSIVFILGMNVFMGLCLIVRACIEFPYKNFTRAISSYFDKNWATIFLILPAFSLFFYDQVNNFYRNIFINFLIVVGLIFSIDIKNKVIIIFSRFYIALILIAFIASVLMNWRYFRPQFTPPQSYQGPSISRYINRNALNASVDELVRQCSIDRSRGGIIVDDLTYEPLKNSPKLYPITYVQGIANIANVDISVVTDKFLPNAVIARCGSMEGAKLGIPFKARSGDICCTTLGRGR
ncbi:hypothetical protein G6703_01660 [Polynucleobacter paneuropaeus]|nr:hypothetical protein G6703_01660 [Polynucleobacter paneuropaeus]